MGSAPLWPLVSELGNSDSAYAGKLVDWAKQPLDLTIKPVSRPEAASG
jgi:hypothetical protein